MQIDDSLDHGTQGYMCDWHTELDLWNKAVSVHSVLLTELLESGAPERIRTSDLCLRRATLYPAELRAHRRRGRIVHTSLSSQTEVYQQSPAKFWSYCDRSVTEIQGGPSIKSRGCQALQSLSSSYSAHIYKRVIAAVNSESRRNQFK